MTTLWIHLKLHFHRFTSTNFLTKSKLHLQPCIILILNF